MTSINWSFSSRLEDDIMADTSFRKIMLDIVVDRIVSFWIAFAEVGVPP